MARTQTLTDPKLPALDLTIPGEGEAVYDAYNERLKLYGVDVQEAVQVLDTTPAANLAGKVTVYAHPGESQAWREVGFQQEAVIKGFFEDRDAYLWAAYTDNDRGQAPRESLHDQTVELARGKSTVPQVVLPEGYECNVGRPVESPEIAHLLGQTFEDYPTPIHPDIIEEQIRTRANHFRVVRDGNGQVAAVASAEMDHLRKSAEMTDCATRPQDRGRGLMAHILRRLEDDIARMFDITDLYTLARADEVGMNCAFSKLGYEYSGRLVNNCRMPNGWESMNVWCKESRLN